MAQILFDIRRIIDAARGRVARSINHEMTILNDHLLMSQDKDTILAIARGE